MLESSVNLFSQMNLKIAKNKKLFFDFIGFKQQIIFYGRKSFANAYIMIAKERM